MPQAPQGNIIAIPLGGLPGGKQDFRFFGRNVLRVTFLFVPSSGQCVTLTNSGVFVQPDESGTRQLLLNRIAHDIRFDPDNTPPQMNTGEDGFTVWAGTDALAGDLYYWVDHTLSQISLGDAMSCNCDEDCGEAGPCQNSNVMSVFEDDFQSIIVDAGGALHSNQHYETAGDVDTEERRNGWVRATATEGADAIAQTFQRTFGPVAAPGRVQDARGRVYVGFPIT